MNLLAQIFAQFAPEKAVGYMLDTLRQRAGLQRKSITLPGGLHYVYLEGGEGEPLMLLHGFGGNKDNFNMIARYLTPHYRVIVPDHIGFGESAKPMDADYHTEAQAERLMALAQALGAPALHLGGNSMGGHIALAFAARFPQAVKSLWLLAPGGVWSAPPSELAQIVQAGGDNPLLVRSAEDFARTLAFTVAKLPEVPMPYIRVMAKERMANHALELRVYQQIKADPIEERARTVQAPSLIVWGEEDRVLHPEGGTILQRLMPQAELIRLPGVGHLPMIERPQECAADYLRFRARLAA
ncbi:MAG: alpha/beta hydrolase [Caldimonas manganoxidans]|uniref:alpha/beta fold hydrolase n=1 Tax=Caldimonas TaxID=196013 RepID=UPI00036CC68F|nr:MULTISPECIES: alpha/beta hydrolase [Caldimonas]MCX7660646.1 alpha/beta hydrolase [Caldimonas manganoxidans]GIX25993.1 MAG: lipase [Caldimonas sp.]